MSNLVWRDGVPDGSSLIVTVSEDPNEKDHNYVAGMKIWADGEESKVAEFNHAQLTNDGQASFVLRSPKKYTAHVTVTFSGSARSGAIISSRIEKVGGEIYGTSPAPHPVAGKSGDVGWQTISIRTKS